MNAIRLPGSARASRAGYGASSSRILFSGDNFEAAGIPTRDACAPRRFAIWP
jgi:hypothetical protein